MVTRAADRLDKAARLGAGITSLGFLLLAAASWGTWPDVTVDFGQQLYIPWRIAEGEVLYRDLPYLHGPLSQYLNALLFRLFGASLTTLVLANLTAAVATCALLQALLRRLAGELAATVGGLLFVALFAFAQLQPTGNYNFVTPYVHEATHGLLLGLLALFLVVRHLETGRGVFLTLAGLALGLCFLTKAECFAAALLALAAMLGRRVTRPVMVALVPPAGAFLLFLTALPAGDALQATLGPWRPSLYESAALPFFRALAGTDDLPHSLAQLAVAGAAWAAVLGAGLTAEAWVPRERARPAAVALFAVLAGALLLLGEGALREAARPLPIAVAVLFAVTWRRGPLHRGMAVLAFVLLLKVLFHARLDHYGFFLALPATLLVTGALVELVPRALDRRGYAGALFQAAALAAIAAVAAVHLNRCTAFWATKTVLVGEGRDRFRADARGEVVNRALAELRRRAGPGETLAALPEGALLNVLAGRRNPTGFTTLTPVETTAFGEARIAAAFAAHPPDWIALVHKDTAEFGPEFADHAEKLGEALTRGYEPIALVGEPPPRFGIRLLRRKRV